MVGRREAEKEDKRKFIYSATSNLVLSQPRSRGFSETNNRDDSGDREITGEALALRSENVRGRMGDCVGKLSGPPKVGAGVGGRGGLVQKRKRVTDKDERAGDGVGNGESMLKRRRRGGIVEAAEEVLGGVVVGGGGGLGKIGEMAFGGIMAWVENVMGGERDVVVGAAEEIVEIMKGEGNMKEKEKLVAEIVRRGKGGLSEEELARLGVFVRQIDHWKGDELNQEGEGGDGAGEEGVAVVFGDSESEEDEEGREVVEMEDSDEDAESGPTLARDEDKHGAGDAGRALVEKSTVQRKREELDPLSIGPFWLQEKLEDLYTSVEQRNQVAEELFMLITNNDISNQDLEDRVVRVLDFQRFDIVKMLLLHRKTISYCVRLKRAGTQQEKNIIESEMKKDVQGTKLLALLQGTEEKMGGKGGGLKKLEILGADKLMEDVVDDTSTSTDQDRTEEGESFDFEYRSIDLEEISFAEGGRFMSSRQCKLPDGTEHFVSKDYEEWNVPATRIKSDSNSEKALIPISSLPEWARQAFPNATTLNRVQSIVYPCAFESDENMLLCAPTGAGKTNVAVLAILRAVANSMKRRRKNTDTPDWSSFKVVYVAPMKALVSEVVGNLGNRLQSLGMTVRELTGDINLTQEEINQAQVIVTTPEKWDIVTRKAGERAFTSLVRLMIIDEIHLLHDDRGPVLEAIIARTVRGVESGALATRIVGLSATLPNYEDVAISLHVDASKGLFHFSGAYRPCPLQQCYVGITVKKALRRFQLMNDLAYEKVKSQVVDGNNQAIVFVHSRKDTGKTAQHILDRSIEEEVIDSFTVPGSPSYEIIKDELTGVNSSELKNLLEHGFGIHHAGLSRKDRSLVESLFAAGHIKMLVSTATLAWGVNLPAHAVIIKGTQVYSPEKSQWIELSSMDVMQMMGRAGRPQYDSYGEGFIITTKSNVLFYLTLLNQQLPIESQLISRLPDLLNSEVAIGSVASIQDGVRWLGYTYLSVRMIRNPSLYGVNEGEVKVDSTLRRRRAELIHASAILLNRHGLVRYDENSGLLKGTNMGRIASNYYIGYKTMSVYQELMKPTMGNVDLLRVFALSKEFEHMYVRQEEKLELSRLAERVPIPIRGPLDEASAKVIVLLQSYVSRLKLDGLALAADMIYVTQSAGRLARALFEIALLRGWAPVSEKCLNLCKMIAWRQWPSQTPLRQFSKANYGILTEDVIRKIERKDVEFERYFDLTSGEVGELLRDLKKGKTVHRLIHYLPHVEMNAKVRPLTRSSLRMNVSIMPDFRFDRRIHGVGELFHLSVEDADGDVLLHAETFYLGASLSTMIHTLEFTVPITKPRPPQYFLRLSSDRWICPDSLLAISLRHLELPEKFAPHTEILDAQPLSTLSALKNCKVGRTDTSNVDHDGPYDERGLDMEAKKEVEAAATEYFSSRFEHFNSIQTQAFHTLYHTDSSAVLCSGTGSGRFVCCELVLFRTFALKPTACVIVVIPESSTYTISDITNRFKKGLGCILKLNVVKSQGNITQDLITLNTPGTIFIMNDKQLNTMTRRWKSKKQKNKIIQMIIKYLTTIIIFGIDNLEKSPRLEVCISRLRYLNYQFINSSIRFFCIGNPVANILNISSWIGANSSSCFSFKDQFNDFIQLETVSSPLSVESMARNIIRLYRNLFRGVWKNKKKKMKKEKKKKTLVFVSGIGKAHVLGMEIMMMSRLFDDGNNDDVRERLLNSSVDSQRLRQCLEWNVGFITEEVSQNDKRLVLEAWNGIRSNNGLNELDILVTTYEWARCNRHELEIVPDLIVIAGTLKDTESIDGECVRRVEYDVGEVRFMGSFAGIRDGCERGNGCIVYLLVERPLQSKWMKELGDAVAVESGLVEDNFLMNAMNSEICNQSVQSKEDFMHWLTWTFFYRRLLLNPGFYGMDISHNMVEHEKQKTRSGLDASIFLSDLIEDTIEDLVKAKCIVVEDDENHTGLAAIHFGMIASHYQVDTNTIELFASLITEKTRIVGLLDILSSANEFSTIEIIKSDPVELSTLAKHSPITVIDQKQQQERGVKSNHTIEEKGLSTFADPHIKTHLLLQSHFSRTKLSKHFERTKLKIVSRCIPMIESIVDICITFGYLQCALDAMELSKMIIQGLWDKDSSLLQLPFLSHEVVKQFQTNYKIETIYDLLEMSDDDRNEMLKMFKQNELRVIANAANQFPSLKDIVVKIENHVVSIGSMIKIHVIVEREEEEEEEEEEER